MTQTACGADLGCNPTSRCRRRSATTTRSKLAFTKNLSKNYYLARQLPVEPAVRQLLGSRPDRRERPQQPEHRPPLRLSAACRSTRPATRSRARWPPTVRTRSRRSSSTSCPFGTTRRRQRVRRERHPEDARNRGDEPARTRSSTWAAAATAGCRSTRRPTSYVQHEFKLGGAKRDPDQPQRPEPVRPGDGDQLLPDRERVGRGAVEFDEADFYAHKLDFTALKAAAEAAETDPRFLMDNGYQTPIQARIGFKFLF